MTAVVERRRYEARRGERCDAVTGRKEQWRRAACTGNVQSSNSSLRILASAATRHIGVMD